MGVLVAIDVGDKEACALQSPDLCFGLAGDFLLAHAAEQDGGDEVRQGRPKALAVAADKRGYGGGWQNRNAVGQHDMTA